MGECVLLYLQGKCPILLFKPYQCIGKSARPIFLVLPYEFPCCLHWSLNCQAQATKLVPSWKQDCLYPLLTLNVPLQSEPQIDPY